MEEVGQPIHIFIFGVYRVLFGVCCGAWNSNHDAESILKYSGGGSPSISENNFLACWELISNK